MKIFQSVRNQSYRAFIWFQKSSSLVKIIICALIIGISWASYTAFFKTTSTTPSYQTEQAEKGTLIVTVTASGQVSSTNNASITTQSTGVVSKVYAPNGTVVKAGDPIAEITLDQSSQQKYTQALASYQSAQNSLTSAQAQQWSLQAAMFNKWDTFKKLAETDTYKDPSSPNRAAAEFHIPEKEWLASEANYKNQEKVIVQAQTAQSAAWLSLQQSSPVIYAPISGTVTGLSLQEGSVILTSSSSDGSSVSSQKVASIQTEANPTVTINLTEIDVTKVKVGDKTTITLDAFPDKTFTGKVLSIDTIGSVTSGVTNYPSVIALDVQNASLLPNMSATANIITQTKSNVLMVPVSAVTSQDGESFVQVMKKDQPQQVSVQTGISSDTHTEIISGLNVGDTVVTSTISTSTTQSATQTQSPFSSFGGGRGGGNIRVIR